MRKYIFLFVIILFCLPESSTSQSLVIRHRDGTSTLWPISELSSIEMNEHTVRFINPSGSLNIPNDEVLTISYLARRGDVNRDFFVDISDVVSVINVMAGDESLRRFSDVNDDGNTDISDVVAIINEMSGLSGSQSSPGYTVDNASILGDIMYVYRTDGEFNMFLRDEIEKISFAPGVQTVQTADSIYTLPLDNIECMSFIHPETVYRPETIRLDGELQDYIVEASSLRIKFSPETPPELLPKVGDKIAALDISEKFPAGIAGIVTNINGDLYFFREIDLEDVAERFYGYALLSDGNEPADTDINNGFIRLKTNSIEIDEAKSHMGAPFIMYYPYVGTTQSSRTGIKAQVGLKGWLKRVVDSSRSLSYVGFHATCDVKSDQLFRIVGELREPVTIPACKKSFKLLWNTYMYMGVNQRLDVTGNSSMAFSADLLADFVQDVDINYYPAANGFNTSFPCVNSVRHHASMADSDIRFTYAVVNGPVKTGFDCSFGVLSRVRQENWLGATFSADLDMKFKGMPTDDALQDAGNATKVYESVKNGTAKIQCSSGGHGNKTLTDNRFGWDLGDDYSLPTVTVYDGFVFPHFSDVKFIRDKTTPTDYSTSAKSSSCLLTPSVLGFIIFDEEGNVARTPVYHEPQSPDENTVSSYNISFYSLRTGHKYRAHPVVKCGGYDLVAAPYAELNVPFCPDNKHPHAIDLGIGVKWACCNVGASAPWEKGNYYSWGETETKSTYVLDTYKYYDKKSQSCIGIGVEIAGTKYDVAHVKWGGSWVMPNFDEIKALYTSCPSESAIMNGVEGRKFYGSNGNTIFMPNVVGRWDDNTYFPSKNDGEYWGSTQIPRNSDASDYASMLYFNDKEVSWNGLFRPFGLVVRPVSK